VGDLKLIRFGLLLAVAGAVLCAQPRPTGDCTGKFKLGDQAPDFALKVMHKETEVGRVFLPAAGLPAGWTRSKAGPRP
jgi:hypothetical protein